MATSAPFSFSSSADARAMPDAPPTMTAFLPLISTSVLLSSTGGSAGTSSRSDQSTSSTGSPNARRPPCTSVSSGLSGWNLAARMSR